MKRILSLDGGGIRGVFSLMVLQRIEDLFRQERKNEKLVLRDEFDFFVGTSTGAVIASFVAWGYSVQTILDLYVEQGGGMFAPAGLVDRMTRHKYDPEAIAEVFKTHFRDRDGKPATLGTDMLQEGDALKYLMVVMRNASTGSPWPVTNNPAAKYSRRSHPECNLEIPIWQLLRASTAAPTFFPPEEIVLGKAKATRIFVDGGLTPYNNPALIAVLTATLPNFNMGWKTGVDELHVVSVGTGSDPAELPPKEARKLNLLDFARYVAPAMIESVAVEQDMICRILGDCLAGENLDREIYDLRGPGPDLLGTAEKKFTYVRYNTKLKADPGTLGSNAAPTSFEMDNLDTIPALKEIGGAFAARAVKREHLFAPFARDPSYVPVSVFASDAKSAGS
jgi:predicted acylesterase/phospholipase RssA